MRIAYYEPEYFETCTELLINYYNNDLCKCHFTDTKAQHYLAEIIETPRFIGFLLLDDQDNLIGTAMCHERTWWYKDELYIDEFLIHPEHQHQGHGSQLIRFIEKYAKEQELAGITLITNNLAMVEFYQRKNFHNHDICFMYKGLQSFSS